VPVPEQPVDDAGARFEDDPHTLMLGDGVVDGVGVAEVVGLADASAGDVAAGETRQEPPQGRHQLVGLLRVQALVVVSRVVVAAISPPMRSQDRFHAFAADRQDI